MIKIYIYRFLQLVRTSCNLAALVCSLCLILFCPLAASAAQAANHQQLDKLQNKIKQLKSHLNAGVKQSHYYQLQLKKAELASGRLAVKLDHTQKNLHFTKKSLTGLRGQAVVLQQRLEQSQLRLGLQMRQLYMLGQPNSMQIFLEQQDPAQTMRMMTYYHLLQQAQQKSISQAKELLDDVANNRLQTQAQVKRLQGLHQQLSEQRTDKLYFSTKRKQALQQLSTRIRGETQKLQSLQSEREQLQQTLLKLRKNALRQRALQGSGKYFKNLQHHLQWPLSGRILQAYGTPLSANGQLRTDGVLISAHKGQPVRAIASGRVVFADWLAGYGLLVIVDHGAGYMSLYGRNQSLLVSKGQEIAKGDLLAKAGDSGGFNQTSLYFAIRHAAKPLDPVSWMQGRPTA